VKEKKLKEDVWVVISYINADKIVVGVTDSTRRRYLFESVKSGQIQRTFEDGSVSLKILDADSKNNVRIKFGDFHLLMDIKYVKSDSVVDFKVGVQKSKSKITFYVISALLSILLAAMLLPISVLTKRIAEGNSLSLKTIFPLLNNTSYRSIIISMIYLSIYIVSLLNINFLKGYNNILYAAALVINFWILIFTFISSIWIFPLASHFRKSNILSIMKYAYLVSFSNILTSILIILLIFLFLIIVIFIFASTLGLFISIVLFVFPGLTGLLLFLNICFVHVIEKQKAS
jgi:uncharacterized membrane protein YesL